MRFFYIFFNIVKHNRIFFVDDYVSDAKLFALPQQSYAKFLHHIWSNFGYFGAIMTQLRLRLSNCACGRYYGSWLAKANRYHYCS